MKQKLLRNRIMGNALRADVEPIDEEEKKRIVLGVVIFIFFITLILKI